MRRWILLLLLVIVPTQLVWAATVKYVGQRDAMHAHTPTVSSAKHDRTDSGATVDAAKALTAEDCATDGSHCAHCHAHAVAAPDTPSASTLHASRPAFPRKAHIVWQGLTTSEIERPKWAGVR